MSRLFANNGRLDGVVAYPSNQCTFGGWVKRGASATDMAVHFGAAGSADGFYIQVSSVGVVQGVVSSGGSAIAANASLAINDTTTWHLLTATIQDTGGGALKVTTYVDGANAGTQTLTRTPALASVIRIGANLNATGFWTGRIAHVFRYSALLTPTEILALLTNVPSDIRRDVLVFYDPFTQNRNPELDDVGGVELALTNATFDTDNPPIGPPTILTVGTVQQGAALTITGTGFTTPTVTIGGVSQTVNSSSDTSATINTVNLAAAFYGDQAVSVTNTRGLSDSLTVPALPPTGYAYVTLVAPLAPVNQRVTSTPVDLQPGWQLEYQSLSGTVQMLEDGSAIAVSDAFSVRVNDGTGYGASGTQLRADPVAPPQLTGLLGTATAYLSSPTQISVAGGATGWVSVTTTSGVLAGLGLSLSTLGLITGSPNDDGPFVIPIRYTNAGGNTDTTFVIDVLLLPSVIGTPPNLSYTTLSGAKIVSLSQYFSDATDYSASPPFPVAWPFVNGVVTISTMTPGHFGPYTITGTNPGGSAALATFTVDIALYKATVRTQINDHENVLYFSTYFGPGGSYSIFPAVPPGWRFYSALGRIVYPADEEGDFVFTVTDILTGRYMQLTMEVFSGVLPLRPRTLLREFLL